jgi:hypothetical protein
VNQLPNGAILRNEPANKIGRNTLEKFNTLMEKSQQKMQAKIKDSIMEAMNNVPYRPALYNQSKPSFSESFKASPNRFGARNKN